MSRRFPTREYDDGYDDEYNNELAAFDEMMESDDYQERDRAMGGMTGGRFADTDEYEGDRGESSFQDMMADRSMGPPLRHERFDRGNDDMRANRSIDDVEDRRSGAFGPPVDGRRSLFSDDLIEEMADERDIELFRARPDEEDFWGQRHGYNDRDQLEGTWAADGNQRESSLLSEGFTGGSVPRARNTMPRLEERSWNALENMPEGAVGYVGRYEHERNGRVDGPFMHPMDREIDERYVRRHEEATRPGLRCYDADGNEF